MKLSGFIQLVPFSLAEEQVLDLIFGQERPTQNAHDFKDTAIESEVMFDNSNQTNGSLFLSFYGIPEKLLSVSVPVAYV